MQTNLSVEDRFVCTHTYRLKVAVVGAGGDVLDESLSLSQTTGQRLLACEQSKNSQITVLRKLFRK